MSAPAGEASDGLEDLIVEALELLEREGPSGVERLLARHPPHAARVRSHLERIHRLGLVGDGADATREIPQRLGEFRIVSVLGQGGMGVVYRAVQESLGREVALKLVRPELLYFPGARERFQREVELVARMQHPGIVPVHAVGSEGGVPYFAMELVRGATLADVLADLGGREARSLDGADLDAALARRLGEEPRADPAPLFRGAWSEVVLRILRELAETLEHAHRRGVLHRDVKPSNVMVTREGRVLLLDFGLAGARGAERTTRTGSQLGSLAYMAPELLSGEVRELDARSDVYALGATGWELLTLRLPYASSDPIRLRELSGTARRPRLETIQPGLGWDVETVIATALEPDPQRRYASASELARDLDHLLAHRPIEAREIGPALRLRRWSQRHPARATALVALALGLLLAPLAWAWQENDARRRVQEERDALVAANAALEIARGDAERESARARDHFERLQRAVDTMLTRVGDEDLRDVPRMGRVRRDLLEEARRFYDGFLSELPDDPRLRAEAARIRLRTAEITGLLGDYEAAASGFEQAIEGLEAAGDGHAERDVAQARQRLAGLLRLRGDLDAALAVSDEAIEGWRTIGGAERAHGLAEARLERALILADRGDLAAALREIEASLAELAAASAEEPMPERIEIEARSLGRIATWLAERALQGQGEGETDLRRAAALHERARDLWNGRFEQGFADSGARSEAVRNAIGLGVARQTLGEHEPARAALEQAVGLAQALVEDFPESPSRRVELATARGNLAAVRAHAGDLAGAGREYAATVELWRGLRSDRPRDDEVELGLAQALMGTAWESWQASRWDEVRVLVEEAARACDAALAVRPDRPTSRRVRRRIWNALADLELEQGRHAQAALAARRLDDPALAPGEPLVVAALIARCAPAAEADPALPDGDRTAVADRYRDEALAVFEAARRAGRTLADLRADLQLVDQWGQPGFEELIELVWDEGG
jgi:serine/threonine protein kinase